VALRVQWQAGAWISTGVLAGVAGSLALSGAIRGLLFEVSPADPISLVVPVITLCAVGILAAWLPARRAAQVDPVVALRCE
jgi:ABC-type antimicrobial peptide transport system permease subunit